MKINSLVTNWKAIGLPGLLLVGLAVLFESRREAVLARIKALTHELTQWE
jgi:hypothetical protein